MLFKKYHIVIFKDRGGAHRNLHLRGWLGVFLALLFIAMGVSNFYLWQAYTHNYMLGSKLENAEKIIEQQNRQIFSLSSKVRLVNEDISRVQQFNSKLRVMLNIDKEPAEVGPAVGSVNPTGTSFSQSFLYMHRQELMTRRMHSFLDSLNNDIRLEEVRQQELMRTMRDNRELLISTPSIWPAEGILTSTFGGRASPFSGSGAFHKGLDISNRPGTPIHAPARGTASFVGTDGSYGNCVILDHGNSLSTRYAHMLRSTIKEGQMVNRGDIIGYIGNSGRSTGPHLHYEVRIGGVCVNPMRYILN